MLYLKDEFFKNTDFRELNMWATQIGAGRSPRDQLLGFRFQEACDKFKIDNALALWCYGATKTNWFFKAATTRECQIRWCEALASEFARLGDIRLMDLTEDEQVIMTLIWTQATKRLDEYAKFKKPVEPKLPTKPEPTPIGEKKEEPKEAPKEPNKPERKNEEGTPKDEKQDKSRTMQIIGSIAAILAVVIAWLPIPVPIKSGIKIILNAIASIFR